MIIRAEVSDVKEAIIYVLPKISLGTGDVVIDLADSNPIEDSSPSDIILTFENGQRFSVYISPMQDSPEEI